MARPTNQESKAALDKLTSPEGPIELPPTKVPALSERNANKNRIGKQGV